MSMIQPKWAERGRIIPLYTEAGPINVLKASLSKWPQIIKAPELTHKWCNYYSPDTIRWLKESHLNFIMVGWSVGFSIKAEKIQRDLVTEFINKCHAEGINVGLYICWANMFWQSMFEDVPESRKWCAVGPDGKTMKKYKKLLRSISDRIYRIDRILASGDWLRWDRRGQLGCGAATTCRKLERTGFR